MNPFRCRHSRPLAVALLLGVGAAHATAQTPVMDGAPKYAGGALPGSATDSAAKLLALADTNAALAHLHDAVRREFRDAAAWHLLGLINWTRIQDVRGEAVVWDQHKIRQIAAADSSLRIATQLAPDSARYWLSLARFSTRSPYSTVLFSAQSNARDAYASALATGDYPLLALAADMQGMYMWRRYEASARRGFTMDGAPVNDQALSNLRRDQMADAVKSLIVRPGTPTGNVDFTFAVDRFTQATTYEATSLRFARHLFMALADREQWTELLSVATRRAETFPLDHSSRMARGLALQRLGRTAEARAAFDTAFVTMDDEERARLTSLARILKWRPERKAKESGVDSASFLRMTPAQQASFERMYWFMNDDVSWSGTSSQEVEFLARVTYADIRYTDEDRGARGAETDRGNVYIRYGPPDLHVSTGGGIIWTYKRRNLIFFFALTPGFASVRFTKYTLTEFEYLSQQMPVAFDNVRAPASLDTIPARLTRFRRTRDSSDAVLVASVPMASLFGALDVDRLPVQVRIRSMDAYSRARLIDSSTRTVTREAAAQTGDQVWRTRMGHGDEIVRVEAVQPDVDRAARAMLIAPALTGEGFGMSDVLLGILPRRARDAAASATGPSGANQRWSDIPMTPITGTVARGTPLGLLWEVYDAVPREGVVRLRVSLSVRRVEKSGLGPMTLRLMEQIGRRVTRTQRNDDAIDLSYERQTPAGAVVLEQLTLDLSDTSPGTYTLVVQVEDLATKQRTSRATRFTVP